MRFRTCPLCGGQHADDVFCIRFLVDRVKELESKLGAAEVAATASAERSRKGHIPAPHAAPSVTRTGWSVVADDPSKYPFAAARACDLAAAVTEWYESIAWEKYSLGQAEDLIRIAVAFVRGEPLPEKRNG